MISLLSFFTVQEKDRRTGNDQEALATIQSLDNHKLKEEL